MLQVISPPEMELIAKVLHLPEPDQVLQNSRSSGQNETRDFYVAPLLAIPLLLYLRKAL